MANIGLYDEALHVFISFWAYYSPRGDAFLNGQDGSVDLGASGRGYQAFFFQPLKFTPSGHNTVVTLA
jgi:hypothetical protein